MVNIVTITKRDEWEQLFQTINPKKSFNFQLSNFSQSFKYVHIDSSRSMTFNEKTNDVYFIAIKNNKIIGYINISLGNFEFFGDWITATEVLEAYRQQGVATQLYNALFQWLKANNFKYILGSSYTALGQNMFNMITNIANKSNIYYVRPKDIEKVNTYENLKSKIYNAA